MDEKKNKVNSEQENLSADKIIEDSFAESISAAAESYAEEVLANPPAQAGAEPAEAAAAAGSESAAPNVETAAPAIAPVTEITHEANVEPENMPLEEKPAAAKPVKKPAAKKPAVKKEAAAAETAAAEPANDTAAVTDEKTAAAPVKKAAPKTPAKKPAAKKAKGPERKEEQEQITPESAAEINKAETDGGGDAAPEGHIGSAPKTESVKAFKPKDFTKKTALQREKEKELDPRSVAAKQEKLKTPAAKKKINETNSGLKLLYQPIFEPAKNNLIGFECLLRIYDVELGVLTPGMFLDVAQKDIKLIKRLEDWSIEEVLRSSKKLKEQNVSILSVNISTKHFFDSDFVETTSRIIERAEIKPSNIYFEFREEALFGPFVEVVNKMTALQALGIKIAIDDFGTTFFSGEQKPDFPLDMIKLPFGLIKKFMDDRKSKSLIRIILNYARVKKIDVIALGVETKAQEEALLKMGVRKMQGYLYSKPLATQRMNLKKK